MEQLKIAFNPKLSNISIDFLVLCLVVLFLLAAYRLWNDLSNGLSLISLTSNKLSLTPESHSFLAGQYSEEDIRRLYPSEVYDRVTIQYISPSTIKTVSVLLLLFPLLAVFLLLFDVISLPF